MLSILNVGALVSARFHDDTTSSGGETKTVKGSAPVDWTNVLTPGAFLTVGLAGSPFTVGTGLQVVPVRAIEVISGTETRKSSTPAVQAMAFLAVDVPIFTF